LMMRHLRTMTILFEEGYCRYETHFAASPCGSGKTYQLIKRACEWTRS
jgi:hypothetical protein